MAIKLYSVSDSPPSLAVRMALEYFQVPYEYYEVDFVAGEHLTEAFGKINPQHEVPVLDYDGFLLSESVAILQFLGEKFGQGGSIYPKNEIERGVVNHRLSFYLSTYYQSIAAYAVAPIFYGYKRTDVGLKKVNIALNALNTYLEKINSKYVASDNLTIADFALISATLCLEAINFNMAQYVKVNKWYEMFKTETPNLWKIAGAGMAELKEFNENPPNLDHLNHPFHPKRIS